MMNNAEAKISLRWNFRYAVLCINDPVLVDFISTLVIAFVLVCFCYFPCSEHYISSVKFL